jgi:tRNA-splicing ligase RtcB
MLHQLKKISDYLFEIPKSYKPGMRVPARIYAGEDLMDGMDSAVFEQLSNVAMLPGIVKYALCMPDGHSGYGFPIGGVAAIDPETGVISPGGIGFDINCGVRLIATNLVFDEIKNNVKRLVDTMFTRINSGVGKGGILSLTSPALDDAVIGGAEWAVEKGYGTARDLEYIEEKGRMKDADPSAVSPRAKERGRGQAGSLGSGNHYLEIQVVRKENIFDPAAAEKFGIFRDGQVMIMIHTGSRGYGHEIASEYLRRFVTAMQGRYHINLPDRELACAPFNSKDGQDYFKAMNCAINFAFMNRQLIMHAAREVFSDILKKSPDELGMNLVYDVCHNTAKIETHQIDGKKMKLLVHRKGATRSFTAEMKGVPEAYREVGQPVLIGGSMETGSYLMAAAEGSSKTFYSTVHGSGRVMSRSQAKKIFRGIELQKKMMGKGIYVQTSSMSGLAEESGAAYKNVDRVVQCSEAAGLSRPIAKLIPIGNIKG